MIHKISEKRIAEIKAISNSDAEHIKSTSFLLPDPGGEVVRMLIGRLSNTHIAIIDLLAERQKLLEERKELLEKLECRSESDKKGAIAVIYLAGKLAEHVEEMSPEIMLNAIEVADKEITRMKEEK
ncbi:MAG: hypothetical protein BA863_10325 [Desulfovibrio sp. S3730MH75]|nr:MAG: hypothetical protein BA863_10325 [Desulfovibrio sp. S3730MH75]